MSYGSYAKPQAYTNAAPEPGNPRMTEAWALTEAGRRMAMAIREDAPAAMRDALRLNWRLWTIFQAELTTQADQPDVTLDEVRTNMLSLCQFVDKQTVAALVEPSAEKLQVLVDINRNIAAGLMDSVHREEGSAQAASETAAETNLTA